VPKIHAPQSKADRLPVCFLDDKNRFFLNKGPNQPIFTRFKGKISGFVCPFHPFFCPFL